MKSRSKLSAIFYISVCPIRLLFSPKGVSRRKPELPAIKRNKTLKSSFPFLPARTNATGAMISSASMRKSRDIQMEEIRSRRGGKPGERVIIGNTGHDVATKVHKWANQCVGQCQTTSRTRSRGMRLSQGQRPLLPDELRILLPIDRYRDRSATLGSRYIDLYFEHQNLSFTL